MSKTLTCGYGGRHAPGCGKTTALPADQAHALGWRLFMTGPQCPEHAAATAARAAARKATR